jgi:23S rRNA (guanosine2251-2'-O)-methyltransferase
MPHASTTPAETSLVIGRKPVQDLLRISPEHIERVLIQDKGGPELGRIMDLCRRNRIRFSRVPKTELDALFSGNHQGVVARSFRQGFKELDEVLEQTLASPLQIALALDQLQDPGNVGTLARTLYAVGGSGLILPKNRSAALGEAATKASAGALSRCAVTQVTNMSRALEACREAGFQIYGACLDPEADNLFAAPLHTPAVLVLGNEDKGIRPGVLKRCHQKLYIPMHRQFDSMNVAQAGAMILGQFLAGQFKA